MIAPTFLDHLRRCGFDFRLGPGGVLLVSPASELTEEDRLLLAAHKPALLLILAGKGPRPDARIQYRPEPGPPTEWTWEGAPGWFPTSPESGSGQPGPWKMLPN